MAEKVQKKKILNREFLKFIVMFNLLAIPMYVVLIFDIDFIPLQKAYTFVLKELFSFLGYQVERSGILLYFDSLVIDISRDCIGWKSAYTLLALILATPYSTVKEKMKFYIKTLPTLVLLNFLRVVIATLIGINFTVEAMRKFHFVAQLAMVGIVLLLWLKWLNKVKHILKK